MIECEYCGSKEKLVTVVYSQDGVEKERKMLCEACDSAEANLFEDDDLEHDEDE